MKKIILAVALGICMQPAFAEVQIAGKVLAVAAGVNNNGLNGITPVLAVTEHAFIIDTVGPDFNDWNAPGEEFTTQCGAYPIGNIVIIDTQSDGGKLAMSMLVSAKLTDRPVMVIYTALPDAGYQTGFKCLTDTVVLM